ncbi:Crp/Fnr family transcriptional regulator [Oceanobacillus sp. FSL W7-1293]|uniref:Crp/Fnr family transcriptional regulator n=1 Tax=Oceanobacillus TaxID=182709 RepID=UPI0030CCD00A
MQTSALLQSKTGKDSISEELRAVLHSIGTVKNMEKHMYLFHEGTESEQIFIIKSGLVQVSKLTADGKEMILRICKQQDIIGELTIFSDDSRYMLSAKIIDSGEVLVIQKDQLEKALMSNPHLTFEYLKWTSSHMRKYQSKIRDLLLNGKKGALYSTIIRLSNSYGINKKDGILIDLVLTNQELAKFCAATRESVNRMLVDLRKRDIISMDKSGRIFIKDIDYLRDQIGCENCPIEICNIN